MLILGLLWFDCGCFWLGVVICLVDCLLFFSLCLLLWMFAFVGIVLFRLIWICLFRGLLCLIGWFTYCWDAPWRFVLFCVWLDLLFCDWFDLWLFGMSFACFLVGVVCCLVSLFLLFVDLAVCVVFICVYGCLFVGEFGLLVIVFAVT